MSSLTAISATVNQFNGSLPPNMFHTLPNLQEVGFGGNQFSGPIPPSIINASFLTIFDISVNHFSGQVSSLGKILDLRLIPIDEATTLEGNNLILNANMEKCLVSLFRIGLACSMNSPKERMDVVDITRELSQIRKDLNDIKL
ncbi:hypothetical protein JHK85_001922 [Glycine max]|nr:hypothetical protein JHK85_001922 [Glycine max]